MSAVKCPACGESSPPAYEPGTFVGIDGQQADWYVCLGCRRSFRVGGAT